MMYGYYLADENRLAVDGDRHSKVVSPLKRVRRFGSDMIDFIPEGYEKARVGSTAPEEQETRPPVQ